MRLQLNQKYRELFFFIVVGLSNTACYFLTVTALTMTTTLSLLSSGVIAYGIAMVWSYVLHSKVTFQKELSRQRAQRFCITNLVMLGIVSGINSLSYFQDKALLAALLVSGLIPVLSYIALKGWAFADAINLHTEEQINND